MSDDLKREQLREWFEMLPESEAVRLLGAFHAGLFAPLKKRRSAAAAVAAAIGAVPPIETDIQDHEERGVKTDLDKEESALRESFKRWDRRLRK